MAVSDTRGLLVVEICNQSKKIRCFKCMEYKVGVGGGFVSSGASKPSLTSCEYSVENLYQM